MDVLNALKERRSITFFDPERKVSRSILEELIDTANLSPSSNNLQPWEVIVVETPEMKKLLRSAANNQAKVEEAAAVMIIVANPRGAEENLDDVLNRQVELGYIKHEAAEKSRKAPFTSYGDPDSERRRIWAVKNTSFFAMSLMVAARGYGLETHPMDGFVESKVKEAFGIAENKVIPLLVAVGYPQPGLKLLPRAFRRTRDKFVSFV
jgi:putative NAD(P)H nitroreductase